MNTVFRIAIKCLACRTIIMPITQRDHVSCNCQDKPISIEGVESPTYHGPPIKMERLQIKVGPRPPREKRDRLLH